MNSALQRKHLLVKPSLIHGYGVFADEDIKQGEIIEECYVVILDDDSGIINYCFNIAGRGGMVLGYGAIYNHLDKDFNASYNFDSERSVMIYKARNDIRQGEEIFITYGKNWFDVRYATAKKLSWRFYLRKTLRILQRVSRGALVVGLIITIIYLNQTYVLTPG